MAGHTIGAKSRAGQPIRLGGLIRYMAAGLAAGPGALAILAALISAGRIRNVLPVDPGAGSPLALSHLAAIAAGTGLIVLASGLLAGRRRALLAGMAGLAVVALLRVMTSMEPAGTVLALALIGAA